MKIAVYDRYWPTGGGGEKFAAGIAAALAGEHDVDLLAHDDVDLAWLGERLALDLDALRVVRVGGHAGALSAASAAYDVLVNASYVSADVNRARHGLYVVHFPGPLPSATARARTWLADRGGALLGDGSATVTWGEGFYMPDESRLHALRWTGGDASFTVSVDGPPGGGTVTVPLRVMLGRFAPAALGPVDVTAEVDGATVGTAVVTPPTSRLDRRRTVPLRCAVEVAAGRPATVWLRCPSWVPAELGVNADRRRLGIPVVGVHAGGGARGAVAGAVPQMAGPGDGLDFLDSYDRIVANSAYTRGWTERMWGRSAGVLHPPVTPVAPAAKEPIILSVGRFFLPGTGHGKKQLEMVEAFRRLHESDVAAGWTYHLVGGCAPEHRPYLDQIEEAARGLPVVLHPDATGETLADLYGRASVFWHAAGLGEDPERHPDRFEHFGITTVEAMSAGAVPVVIDAAGQAEIVEHGRSGFRFTTVDGLVAVTRDLIDGATRRAEMAGAARRRADDFAWDPFVARVRSEITALVR